MLLSVLFLFGPDTVENVESNNEQMSVSNIETHSFRSWVRNASLLNEKPQL